MADGVAIADIFQIDSVSVSGSPVSYTFPQWGQQFHIIASTTGITMDTGNGTTAGIVSNSEYLVLTDKNLAQKTVRFDGTGSVTIYSQKRSRT